MSNKAVAVLLLLTASCLAPERGPNGASMDASPGAAAPSVSREGWVRRTLSAGWRDIPPYSVEVPPQLERVNVEGIDSDVAWLSAPGLDVHFDYGMYGGVGGCEAGARCGAGEETIGGRPARTLTSEAAKPDEQGRRFLRSVSIPITAGPAAPPGLPPPPGAISLTASARCVSAALCEQAAAMFRTIEFQAAGPVMPKTKAPPPTPPQPEPPPPTAAEEAERAARYPCTRVGAAEAKAFADLELLGRAPGWQVYGRRGDMVCTAPDASGTGQCSVTGKSRIRLDFPRGTSGFRTNGVVPVTVKFGGSTFGCGPRDRS